jgi:DNA anti-recombination protein RmuC
MLNTLLSLVEFRTGDVPQHVQVVVWSPQTLLVEVSKVDYIWRVVKLDRRLHDISALKMGHRDRVGFLLDLSQELQQLAASMRFSRAMT